MAIALEQAIREAMDRGRVSGIVVAVKRGEQPISYTVVGNDAAGRPLAHDSLFGVASISKMATALVILQLVDAGELGLDDPLRDYLPQAEAAQQDVTLRQLLCHTSGLPLDIPPELAPYQRGLDWPTLAAACVATPLEAAPDSVVRYSNVGFGMLAVVAEQVTGTAFPALFRHMVIERLGIEGYFGNEPPQPVVQLSDVRGERVHDPELTPFNSPFYRSLALPWAGLVTTLAGAMGIVRAFAGLSGGILKPTTRDEAIRNQTHGLAGGFQPPLMWNPCPWGLGPEVRGSKEPHWIPSRAGAESFGHSGGSGCLTWHVPAYDLTLALAGTRTADSGWLLRRAPAIVDALLDNH